MTYKLYRRPDIKVDSVNLVMPSDQIPFQSLLLRNNFNVINLAFLSIFF